MMKRVFGVKKEKLKEEVPLPSVQDASNRSTKRGETVDEKIRKLDATLSRYREQIKRTRPGPAREAIKARAVRVLKQKRIYEVQRDMLCNQTFSLDQVSFATEEIKDAQQTLQRAGFKTVQKLYVSTDRNVLPTYGEIATLKADNKGLKGMIEKADIGMETVANGNWNVLLSHLDEGLNYEIELNLPRSSTGQTGTTLPGDSVRK